MAWQRGQRGQRCGVQLELIDVVNAGLAAHALELIRQVGGEQFRQLAADGGLPRVSGELLDLRVRSEERPVRREWSSDVCSSDLSGRARARTYRTGRRGTVPPACGRRRIAAGFR